MASASTIARAYLQIIPTTEGIGEDLKNALTGDMEETAEDVGKSAGTTMTDTMSETSTSKISAFASKLGAKLDSTFVGQQISKISGLSGTELISGLTTAAVAGAATAAVKIANALWDGINEAVDVGAEAEQLIGGVEKLFGDSADTVLEYANNAYKTAGLSANDYMEQATVFSASLISGLGGDTEAAAELVDLAITDMADNANTFGTSIEEIENAYKGFAKENYTMLDNLALGYGGTESEMIRLINESGILNETISDMDEVTFDQVIEAIHVVQENLNVTGTTAAEASETIQGSYASMTAAITNLQSAMALGEDVGEKVVAVIETMYTYYIGNLLPMMGEVVSQVPEVLSTLCDVFLDEGIDWLMNLANGLSEGIPNLVTSLQNILYNIEIWLLTDGVALVAKLLVFGGTLIVNIATGVLNSIPALIENLISWVPTFFSTILGYDWLGLGKDILSGLLNGLGTMFEPIVTYAQSLGDGIDAVLEPLTDIIPTIAETAMSGMQTIIGTWIPQIKTSFSNLYTSIVSALSNLPTKLVSIITSALTKFISYITGKQSSTSTASKKIYNAVINAISGLPSKLATYATNAMSKFISGITGYVSKVSSGIKKVVSAVTSGVSSLPSSMKSVGTNLVKGLYQGMANSLSWIKSKIKSWVGNVTKFLQTLFGVSSPSTMTDEIGMYLDEGLAGGIVNNTKSVTTAMDAMVHKTIASAQNLGDYSFDMNTLEFETTNTVTTRLSERLEALSQKLNSWQSSIANMAVVLDTGTIVGELTPEIDSQLGRIQAWKGA